MQIHVLDLDGSLPDQLPVARRIAAGRARLHALRSWGPPLRLWALRRHHEAFRSFWRDVKGRRGPSLALLGSGDFHHLTASLVAEAEGPLTVLHFDNHPDWCRTLPRRHCGSWTNDVLAMDHVARVVTIGPCSGDLQHPGRKGANLEALSTGRLELFPWRHPPSRTGHAAMRSGAGHTSAGGMLHWHNLADDDWDDFLSRLMSRIPTQRIWITVDKDVLPPTEAATNWDQGGLPLDKLIVAIRRLTSVFELAGADICGEYAPIRHRNLFKSIEAWLDQPRGNTAADLSLNAAANERLLCAFEVAS